MTIYIPLMDSPPAASAQLDGLTGAVLFLAGMDRPQAAAAFALYRSGSGRSSATFDAAALRVTHGATLIQFAWETNIAVGQEVVWTTVWSELAIEDRLYPSQYLVDAVTAIIRAQRAA